MKQPETGEADVGARLRRNLEALAARPFYVSPQLIERVRFGMPVSQEQFSNDRERTVTHLIGQLTEIVNARAPKEADQEFARSMQALIELAGQGTDERAVLESLSNHARALGERADSLLDKVRG